MSSMVSRSRNRVAGMPRSFWLGAAAVASAAALAACGGASASQSASQALTAGIAAQKAGNYATATSDYAVVLKAEPKNVYALYDLGDVEQYLHQDTAAAAHYEQALAINPSYQYAMYNLAILDATSNPTASKALYLQIVTAYPKDAVARFNLGKVELSLGEKKLGDAQINLAVSLDSSLKAKQPAGS